MDIRVLASSSAGNCYQIQEGSTSLLLDPGININRIKQALNYRLSDVDGCLVTHEHGDHAKAVKDIIKAGIDVYMSGGTINTLGLTSHRLHEIRSKVQFYVKDFAIKAFEIQHDAAEPLGFIISSKESKLLYATDTYYIKYKVPGLTHIMVECNYCKDILDANVEAGAINPVQRRRLMQSHFSLENLKEFFKANDLRKVQEIYLLHLSNGNSDEARFKREIQGLTGKVVIVCPNHI